LARSGGIHFSGPDSGGTMDNTVWDFSGIVFIKHDETITITHDDGLTLDIAGSPLSGFTSGPTSPTVQSGTWTGPSGVYAVNLVYGECCGPPAVLQAALAPEPSTWAMILAGFAGLGFVGYRKTKQSRALVA
jgi:hypothetical protein